MTISYEEFAKVELRAGTIVKEHHTRYQVMIRTLLDHYSEHYRD